MKLSFFPSPQSVRPRLETVIMTSTLPTPSICIRIFSSFFSRYWTYSCSPSSDVRLPDAVPPLSPDAVLPLPPDVSFSPVPCYMPFLLCHPHSPPAVQSQAIISPPARAAASRFSSSCASFCSVRSVSVFRHLRSSHITHPVFRNPSIP